MWRLTVAALVLAVSASAQQAPAAPVAQAPAICGNQPLCYEASDFAATITDFRTSVQGYYHIIDVTIRFTNKTNGPLILGYANGSGTATDERGNRYAVGGGNALRGIGYVNGQSFDPKFQVNPGGFGDSRFELLLQGNPQVIGFNFELDLTVNEINSYQGNQHTLGGEFPLQFKGLANGAAGAAPGQVAYSNGGAGGTGATIANGGVASIPCQNSSVQNVANGATNTAANVSAAVSSIGSLFGKKAKAAPAVPCTQGASGATADGSSGVTTTGAATTGATTAGVPATGASGATGAATKASPTTPATTTVKPAANATTTVKPAGTTLPAKPIVPATATQKPVTQPVPTTQKPGQSAPTTPAQPAGTQPKPSSP